MKCKKYGLPDHFGLLYGEFPGLGTTKGILIEPDQIIPPAVAAMVRGLRFGVLVPLKEQEKL